jgi:gas vesicle GvpC-like protein
MALKDVWQEQRQQRQQVVAQRQQEVHQTLAAMQQERQNRAIQLKEHLSSYHESLTQANHIRALHAQQFRFNLKQEVQTFLAASSDRRQAQAQVLSQQLGEFVQALQQQVAEFLAATEAERLAMTEQLRQELHAFHHDLSVTVANFRLDMQVDVEERQANTQLLLAANYQQRMRVKAQLTQDLTAFVETLQQEVQAYLYEVEMLRQVRTEQLQQMLQQNRIDRQAEVQSLFDRLATFRAELVEFNRNLKNTVWGTENAVAQPLPLTVKQPQAKIVPTVTPTPATTAVSMTPPVVAPVVAPISTTNGANHQTKNSKNSAANTSVDGQVTAKETHEKNVYNYIHQVQGARLTQIEAALGITRFQAVDALRALIKKGLVTQHDRVYLIQENFAQTKSHT